MDATKTLRMSAMAKEILLSTANDSGAAWLGLSDAYRSIRHQVSGMVPDDALQEFEELFPEEVDCSPTRHPTMGSFGKQDVSAESRSRLASLAGWLDGWIEASERAQLIDAEAKAYAEARTMAQGG